MIELGAIVGVGSVRAIGRVWAWILTIPASSVIAAATFYLLAAVGMP